VISTDFYPTLLDLAGLPPKPKQHLDGVSLTPILKNTGTVKRKNLFWHYPHYSNQGGFPGGIIRSGKWKLIERFEDGSTHLFNLETDIREQFDLTQKYPKIVKQMKMDLHKWYKKVDAKFLLAKPKGPKPWQP
jgi:arylsulfatase A-like enzyme